MNLPRAHLLHIRISHYNEKVCWALDRKRWPHTREALVPGFHVLRVRLLTGQNKMPVLVLDGKPIIGSSRILAEIERLCPDPPLYPEDPENRAHALAIERHFDEEVAPDLRRLFWSTYLDRPADAARMAASGASEVFRVAFRAFLPVFRPIFRSNMGISREELERSRARTADHFDYLESHIGPSGYLVGDRFSVADLTAAAVMSAILRPPQFPYPLPDPWPPGLVELRASFAERPGAKWVEDLYARERDPSCEGSPAAT